MDTAVESLQYLKIETLRGIIVAVEAFLNVCVSGFGCFCRQHLVDARGTAVLQQYYDIKNKYPAVERKLKNNVDCHL